MKRFLFVTDSGRKNEGLRTTQLLADNLEHALRMFNMESVDHPSRVMDPRTGSNINNVWVIKDSDSDARVATIVDMGNV